MEKQTDISWVQLNQPLRKAVIALAQLRYQNTAVTKEVICDVLVRTTQRKALCNAPAMCQAVDIMSQRLYLQLQMLQTRIHQEGGIYRFLPDNQSIILCDTVCLGFDNWNNERDTTELQRNNPGYTQYLMLQI